MLKVSSLGRVAQQLGKSPAAVLKVAERNGWTPALTIDDLQYFDEATVDLIAAEVSGLDSENKLLVAVGALKHPPAKTKKFEMRVRFYLPRLAGHELTWLHDFATECVASKSKHLADWLDSLAINEMIRRGPTQKSRRIREATLPGFDIANLDNETLAGVLEAIWAAVQTVERKTIFELLAELMRVIVAISASRLRAESRRTPAIANIREAPSQLDSDDVLSSANS